MAHPVWLEPVPRDPEVRLASGPRAPGFARAAIRDLGLPASIAHEAELLASELVSNSVRHARLGPDETIVLRATWGPPKLRVEVADHSEIPPAGSITGRIRPMPGATSGWGLFLVDRLAVRWGTAPGRVWFELEDRL